MIIDLPLEIISMTCLSEEQVIDAFAVGDEGYQQVDTQTLRNLRLVSRFVSNQATKVLFRELNLTNRCMEEVTEIFETFSKEHLRCIPRKITHHFYNMVPRQIMADGEISDLYVYHADKPEILPYWYCYLNWIESYFNIVKKFYDSVGPQLETFELQGPSHKGQLYSNGVGTTPFRMELKPLNIWYSLIYVVCLTSLPPTVAGIKHLIVRDIFTHEIMRAMPGDYGLNSFDKCDELKRMSESQKAAKFWPFAGIRRLSFLICGQLHGVEWLYYMLNSCKQLKELVVYNATNESRSIMYARDSYDPQRGNFTKPSISCRLRVLKLTGIANYEDSFWDDCIQESLEVLSLEEVIIGTPRGSLAHYGPGTDWASVFKMCLDRCDNLTEIYLSSLLYYNGISEEPVRPREEDCETSLKLLDDVMLRCQALGMTTSQNHVDIRGWRPTFLW